MQGKIDELVEIAEAREDAKEYYRVTMVGDSTMEHQYGVVCSFLAEREGSRFDPEVCRRTAAAASVRDANLYTFVSLLRPVSMWCWSCF